MIQLDQVDGIAEFLSASKSPRDLKLFSKACRSRLPCIFSRQAPKAVLAKACHGKASSMHTHIRNKTACIILYWTCPRWFFQISEISRQDRIWARCSSWQMISPPHSISCKKSNSLPFIGTGRSEIETFVVNVEFCDWSFCEECGDRDWSWKKGNPSGLITLDVAGVLKSKLLQSTGHIHFLIYLRLWLRSSRGLLSRLDVEDCVVSRDLEDLLVARSADTHCPFSWSSNMPNFSFAFLPFNREISSFPNPRHVAFHRGTIG